MCSEDEERLVRDLFRGYNKLIRPVENMTYNVDVQFGLAFIQLINVVSWQLFICLHNNIYVCLSVLVTNRQLAISLTCQLYIYLHNNIIIWLFVCSGH